MGRSQQVTFRTVFGVAEFRSMWAAEAFSQAGDQLARVALAILVYNRTGSAALTGLTYALTFAPAFLGGIFLSGLADRFPRRDVMITADLLRGGLVALVAIPHMPFAVICVLVGLVSFFQAPFKSAQLALLPDVLPGDLFEVGMGIRQMTIQSAQLVGFAGGGALVGALSPSVALLLDTATFVASAAFVRLGVHDRPAAARTTSTDPSVARSVGAGARIIFTDSTLRVLVLFSWLISFLIVYEGLAAPYTAEIGGGDVAVGLILAADPLGSVIGAMIFSRWVPPGVKPRTLGYLPIAACLPLLVCFAKPGLAVSATLFAVAGAVATMVFLESTTLFARRVPDHSRAQALGLGQSGVATIQGVNPLLAGLLADRVGTAHTVGVFGIIGLAMAIPMALSWRHTLAAETGKAEGGGADGDGSEPLAAAEVPELHGGAADDEEPREPVALRPSELGDVAEVLAVEADDERGR
jgi:MFS family permease